MDYEQKYKEIIEKIRKGLHPLTDGSKISGVTRAFLEEVFPELKESEDEKIKKALIKGVESCKASGWTNFGNNVDIDVVLAWLKEQGKQKPIDYNKELKKCRENPLYFFDKYVKLEKQKPACSEEDERVKKRILLSLEKDLMATKNSGCDTQDLEQCIAWLEKQGQTFTKKDVDDAYLKGIIDAKHELEKQGKSSDQIHYWTEKEIEPIINDYLRGVEHYGGMIGRLRCLKPKSLEKQGGNPAPININKMVMEYSQTKDGDFGLPVNCQIRAYRQGLTDAISTLNFEKQGNSSVKWQKNTLYNKPAINHSVLMKTIQGIAEGEWQGEHWFQYRWSWTFKDSEVLAWMELSDLNEQGEQKTAVTDFNAKDWYVSKVDGKIHDMTYNPADKVEPKFHEGDWINGYYTNYKVTAISNKGYVVEDTDGNKMNILFENEKFHNLWTIQDAKRGDVLVDVYGNIGIFQKNDDFDWSSYCSLGSNGGFRCFAIEHELDGSHPATKEQRDLLFQKMKESGCEWDAEHKQLKKIEQKPNDKVEPKFHKGEWIVWKNKCYKVNYNGCGYELIDQNGLSTWLEYGTVDTSARLYDVAKDAKNGDVLADNGAKIIFIFKNIEYDSHIESNVIKYFIRYSFDGINLPLENGGHLGVVGEYSNFVPATKEQRDTLEKAMADAGWKFDFEKKELKKIEQEPENYKRQVMSEMVDLVIDYIKKKPSEWDEEDERIRKTSISFLKHYADKGYENAVECIDWLKSLKDRVQPQQNPTWSEEDENYLQSAENACEYQYGKNTSTILWLKSLKNRIGG